MIEYLQYLLPILPVLYAEMHYTLRSFSLVYRRWPEILGDVPFRVEPDQNLPVLVLFKDAHRFPVVLNRVIVELGFSNGTMELYQFLERPVSINVPSWSHIFYIPRKKHMKGSLNVNIVIKVKKQGKTRIITIRNDNYPGMSHAPFQVYFASSHYPRLENFYLGDLHYHSDLTHDQAEFGAPLSDTVKMGKAIGMTFNAVTDHSYDLDDEEYNYLKNDRTLPKWTKMKNKIREISKNTDYILLPGEEISAGTHKGRNVHLLVLNSNKFYPGSGDSAEKWFHTDPEMKISKILDDLEERALAVAAHPEDRFNILHRLLLGRGKWESMDYAHDRLGGLQIWNGPADKTFQMGLKRWIDLLLQGKKIYIFAGNDAHGNFNRLRQLRLPFLCFVEKEDHVFGKTRTAVNISGKPSREKILNALTLGRSYVTNGPAMSLEVFNDKKEKAILGGILSGKSFTLIIKAKTTEEFGSFQQIRIWLGNLKQQKEILLLKIDHFSNLYQYESVQNMSNLPPKAYLRADLFTLKNGETFQCLTNPIWIKHTDE